MRWSNKSSSLLRRYVSLGYDISMGRGGSSNGGDGILGSGDDRGDSRDGGGNGDVGTVRHALMWASKADGKGVWGRTVFCALRNRVWDKEVIWW
ncbi:hypothetical protein Tco_1237511 [Tanacetum coccineum]